MKKIMIVDDDAVSLSICKAYLANEYEVLLMSSAVQALGYFKQGNTPDLILLDIYMPGMDGFAFLDQLRENEKWKKLPVILMSSGDGYQTIQEGYEHGANDYLVKPINPVIVMKKIQVWLEYQRVLLENQTLRSQLDLIRQILVTTSL